MFCRLTSLGHGRVCCRRWRMLSILCSGTASSSLLPAQVMLKLCCVPGAASFFISSPRLWEKAVRVSLLTWWINWRACLHWSSGWISRPAPTQSQVWRDHYREYFSIKKVVSLGGQCQLRASEKLGEFPGHAAASRVSSNLVLSFRVVPSSMCERTYCMSCKQCA